MKHANSHIAKIIGFAFTAAAVTTAPIAAPIANDSVPEVATSEQPIMPTADAMAEVKWLLQDKMLAAAEQLAFSFAAEQGRTPNERARFIGELANAAANRSDREKFDDYIARMIEIDATTGHYYAAWFVSADLSKSLSANSCYWLAMNAPKKLRDLTIRKIWSAVFALRKEDQHDKVYGFLLNLKASDYSGYREVTSPEALWLELVSLHLERGRTDEALSLALSDITLPHHVTSLWHDRRYEPLWQSLDMIGKFDTDKMIEAYIRYGKNAEIRGKQLGLNEWLYAAFETASAYRLGGQLKKAARKIERTLQLMPANKLEMDNYAWLKNELAYIYEDMGQTDKALATLQDLTEQDISRYGHLASHMINYAGMLMRAGEYEDAITVTEKVLAIEGVVTNYGRHFAKSIQSCSLQRLGQREAAESLFLDLEAKPKSNYAAAVQAGLCLEKQDFVAGIYLARLKDKSARDSALKALSSFKLPGEDEAATEESQKLAQVAARPEIVVAIKEAGRIRTWALGPGYWGSY